MSLDLVSVEDEEEEEDNDPGEYISTGSKTIDTVFPEGVPKGVLSMAFGQKDIGKTFMCYQLASALYKDEGKKTLMIDTEGFGSEPDTRNRMLDFFVDRWDLDQRGPIDFLFPSQLEDIAEYVGKEFDLVIKGKNNTVRANIWDETEDLECPLAKQIEKDDYGLIVMDSLSQPFKEKIAVPPQQNFSTRASLMSAILGRLNVIVKDKGIGGFLTSHESSNPANPYGTGKPFGPNNIVYTVKYIMQIRGNPKKEKRTFVRFRYPGLTSKRAKRTGKETKLKEDTGFM